ncbi:putative leader peptide [Nakamurella endophytica]
MGPLLTSRRAVDLVRVGSALCRLGLRAVPSV